MNPEETFHHISTLLSVQAFLNREARLLDDNLLEDWLSLFSEDGEYIIPINAGPPPEPAIIRDSRFRLEERVYRLTQTLVHSQSPRSRTQHDITNVEILDADDQGVLTVACNQSIHEMRTGSYFQIGIATPRSFHARCRYILVPDHQSWKIRLKYCELLNREYPIHNLTFIL